MFFATAITDWQWLNMASVYPQYLWNFPMWLNTVSGVFALLCLHPYFAYNYQASLVSSPWQRGPLWCARPERYQYFSWCVPPVVLILQSFALVTVCCVRRRVEVKNKLLTSSERSLNWWFIYFFAYLFINKESRGFANPPFSHLKSAVCLFFIRAWRCGEENKHFFEFKQLWHMHWNVFF